MYADVRDFVNLFLKSNEYGVNLERAAIARKKEANRSQELSVIKGIVGLCSEHRDQVFKDLDHRRKERKHQNFKRPGKRNNFPERSFWRKRSRGK